MIQGTVLDPNPKGVSVKPQPSTEGYAIRKIMLNTTVTGLEIVPDSSDPANINKRWLKIKEGEYVAADYPNGMGQPQIRILIYDETPPAEVYEARLVLPNGRIIWFDQRP